MKKQKSIKAIFSDLTWDVGILLIALAVLHFGSDGLVASGANNETQTIFAVVVVIGVLGAFFLRWRFKRGLVQRDAESFKRVAVICQSTERGIHKRIDENRELFELLQQECPDLLARCPWVEGWLNSQDRFLFDMAATVGTNNPMGLTNRRFPRPWPGHNRKEG